MRLYSAVKPPLIESLLLVFARLVHSTSAGAVVSFLSTLGRVRVVQKELVRIKARPTDKYATSVQTQMVEKEVVALPYLLSKWIEAQQDIHAPYPNKVLHSALAKLAIFLYSGEGAGATGGDEASRAALRNIECKGYVVQPPKGAAPAKRQTRAQTAATGASHEPQYSKIPLSTKLLHTFLHEWKEQRQKQLEREKRAARMAGGDDDDEDDGSDDDDDDEGEFDDSDDDDEDFIARMQAKVRGGGAGSASKSPFAAASDFPSLGASGAERGKLIEISDMLDMHEAEELDEECAEEVYPESLTDPLDKIELAPFLHAFIKDFSALAQGAALRDAAQWLSPADKKVLDAALAAPAAAPQTPKKK